MLLHPNQPVGADRLVAALWDNAPDTAHKMVQMYVSRLRKLPWATDRLVTEPSGYRLRIHPDELDVNRFETLSAEGRRRLANADPDGASRLLQAALSLWRGPALADLVCEPFHRLIAPMEELRIAVIEDRIEADLLLGRHTELIPELETLVAEYPLRERLRGQLMLALYRSGRQAEALDVYKETRRVLVEERGLEPGPELRRLEAAILRQETSLELAGRYGQVGAAALGPVGNLPAPATPIVGRRRELEEVRELIRRPDVRLVTMTGPPGTGKTRLAMEIAAGLQTAFEDGAFFVELASVLDPSLVITAISQSLGVEESGREPIEQTIEGFLRSRRTLLVVDNFEHVISAARVVSDLLAACPLLSIVVTSRAPLRVAAEHEFIVPPLALAPVAQALRSEEAMRYESVELFVQRARAVRQGFVLTEKTAPVVAAICARLDGLPLAIELAAARLKHLSPQALLARLESPLNVLTAGGRDAPAHHQTLRTTIEWSNALLDPAERALLAHLSVFVGGCTVEAAEAVDGAGAPETLDRLASLVDHSLLSERDGPDGEPRFVMLETIRAYAREQLHASGAAAAVHRRHAEYFVSLVETAEPQLTGAEQARWLERLETEHDNVRAALTWCAAAGEAELELRLSAAFGRFWIVRGHLSEGRRWLESVLVRGGAHSPSLRAKALRVAAGLARVQGDFEQTRKFTEERLALVRDIGERREIAFALNDLALVSTAEGRHERAASLYEDSVALFSELGDTWGLAVTTANFADSVLVEGDYERAGALSEHALSLFRELDDKRGTAIALLNLGFVALHERRFGDALALFGQSLGLTAALGYKDGIAYCLEGLAAVAADGGDVERSALLLGSAEALRDEIGSLLEPAERSVHERTAERVAASLGTEQFEEAVARGRVLSADQAVAYAFAELEYA